MKTPARLLLLLFLTTFANAQDLPPPSSPPDVIVYQKSWKREFQSSSRTSNPLEPNERYAALVRAQKAAIKRRDESLPNQPTEERMPIDLGPQSPAKEAPDPTYLYKIRVKNTGSKTIKAISWEYEFRDPDTQKVMGSRRVDSPARIAPGKNHKLERRFFTPPTGIVPANKLGREYRNQFTERVIIHRIDYADGSVWQRSESKPRS